MPRTITKNPGDNLSAGVQSGDVVKVRPGIYPPFSVSGLKGTRWEWAEAGQHWTVDGRWKAEFAVRINDGCAALCFVGMHSTQAGHGVRATKSDGLMFLHYRATNCGAEGFQHGYCNDLLIEDFWIEGTGKGWTDTHSGFHYDPHKGHGIYFSKHFTGGIIRRGTIKDCGGCAIQLNANDGGRQSNVAVSDLECSGCGSEGTPAFNLMGAQLCTFRNVLAVNNNAGFALFSDGGSEPCRGVTFERMTFYQPRGKYGMQSLQGSAANIIRNSIVVTGGTFYQGSGLNQERVERDHQTLIDRAGDYRSRVEGVGWSPTELPVDYSFLG